MTIQLPNETLQAIFENLSPSSLTVVSRASYRFRLVAERILYASIVIQESLPRETPTPRHTPNCASTLLARPHLAEVVRKFSIRWQTDLGPRDEYLPAVAPALRALNAALRTLSVLEQLDLALGLSGAPLDPHTVLDGCAFPALRVFALSGVGRGALSPKLYRGPPASAALAGFLVHTPSIEALHLLDSYEPLALPPGALPRLQVFRGSAIAAAGVLPARPVRMLGLVGHEFITERDLERIARSRSPIRWLDLSLMSVTPLLLRDISRHLGAAVEVLKVKLALRHTLHFALSGIPPSLRFRTHPAPPAASEPARGALARARRVPRAAPARPLADVRRRRRARERARGERALHDLGARVPRPPPRRLPQQGRVAPRPAQQHRRGRGPRHLGRRPRRRRDGMDQALGYGCGGSVLSAGSLGLFRPASIGTYAGDGEDDDDDDDVAVWKEISLGGGCISGRGGSEYRAVERRRGPTSGKPDRVLSLHLHSPRRTICTSMLSSSRFDQQHIPTSSHPQTAIMYYYTRLHVYAPRPALYSTYGTHTPHRTARTVVSQAPGRRGPHSTRISSPLSVPRPPPPSTLLPLPQTRPLDCAIRVVISTSLGPHAHIHHKSKLMWVRCVSRLSAVAPSPRPEPEKHAPGNRKQPRKQEQKRPATPPPAPVPRKIQDHPRCLMTTPQGPSGIWHDASARHQSSPRSNQNTRAEVIESHPLNRIESHWIWIFRGAGINKIGLRVQATARTTNVQILQSLRGRGEPAPGPRCRIPLGQGKAREERGKSKKGGIW